MKWPEFPVIYLVWEFLEWMRVHGRPSCIPLRNGELYTLFEELTGTEFTTSYTRIGGVARDLPDGWLDRVLKFVEQLPKAVDEVEKLLTRNRIFIDRTEGIGEISAEDALAFGLTGRICGLPVLIWTYAKINLTADTKNTILMFPLVREAIATIDTWFELKRFGRV